jgi:hypothetical protein
VCAGATDRGSALVAVVALLIFADAVRAAPATLETIGAEKCGGRVNSYQVAFLSPDTTALEATAKVVVGGLTSDASNAATLSLNGKTCSGARCAFQARKGETYEIAVKTKLRRFEQLCIVVARP